MNSIQRLENRLNHKQVDRIPNLNIIMQFAARYISVPYGKYCTDHRYLVEANLKCCREFGIDMVSAISDPFREVSGLGAAVEILEDDVPRCTEYLIKEISDLQRLKPVDPSSRKRMNDRLEAVALYQESCSKEFPILGWVEGPFAEANDLRGMYQIMYDLKKERSFVSELTEICLEQSILFARAQIESGAQYIGIGDAAASLVSPAIYCDLILPAEKKLIDEIHKCGAKAKLHICGNTTALLEHMAESGADIIDIDHLVDLNTAMKKLGDITTVCGNFDPVSVLLDGTVEVVKENVKRCLMIGGDNIIISAGCEVPKYTPLENLKAVSEMLQEYQEKL